MGKSNWKGYLIMVGILFIVLILAGYGMHQQRENTPPVASQSVCDPMQEVRRVKALEEWVYSKSTKTSRAQCKEIVQHALGTPMPLLMLALMEHESQGFTPTSVSPKGALGLTQVMPGLWEKHLISKGIIKERRDLFDIPTSITAGSEILSLNLKDSKGDATKALDAYLGVHDGAYVKKILGNLANLYVLVESVK